MTARSVPGGIRRSDVGPARKRLRQPDTPVRLTREFSTRRIDRPGSPGVPQGLALNQAVAAEDSLAWRPDDQGLAGSPVAARTARAQWPAPFRPLRDASCC